MIRVSCINNLLSENHGYTHVCRYVSIWKKYIYIYIYILAKILIIQPEIRLWVTMRKSKQDIFCSTFCSLSSIEPDSIKLPEKTGGVPPPQHPAFVQSLAWPTKAVAKQASEAVAFLSRTEKVFETTKSRESSLWERWNWSILVVFTPTTATRRGLPQIRCPHVFFSPNLRA